MVYRTARNVFAALLAIIVIWGLIFATRARAAEPDYFKAWIKGLTSPQGYNCCDIADCHRTVAEHRNGEWWARVPAPAGAFTKVPRDIVINNKPSIDGEAYICHSTTGPYTLYCFVPPNLGF